MTAAARSRARHRRRARTKTHLLLLSVSAALGGSVVMRVTGDGRDGCCGPVRAARIDGPFLARETCGAVETAGAAQAFRRGQRVGWVVWLEPGGPVMLTALLRRPDGTATLAWSVRLAEADGRGRRPQTSSLLLPPDLPPGRYDIVQEIRTQPEGVLAAAVPPFHVDVLPD
jgi:hypothetical protein